MGAYRGVPLDRGDLVRKPLLPSLDGRAFKLGVGVPKNRPSRLPDPVMSFLGTGTGEYFHATGGRLRRPNRAHQTPYKRIAEMELLGYLTGWLVVDAYRDRSFLMYSRM